MNYGSNPQLLEALQSIPGLKSLDSVSDDALLKFNDKAFIQSFDLINPLTENQILYAALDTRAPLPVRLKQMQISTSSSNMKFCSGTLVDGAQRTVRFAGEPVESVKAVVKALAEGSIAPFHKPYDGEIDPKDPYRGAYKEGNKWKAQYKLSGKSIYVGAFETREEAAKAFREATKGMLREDGQDFRKAPLFSPGCSTTALPVENLYTPLDVAKFLGKTKTNGTQSDTNIRTALDALYLLEVKALKVSDIRDLNWSALSQVGIWPSETRGSS